MASSSLVIFPPNFFQKVQEESARFGVELMKTTGSMLWGSIQPLFPYIIGVFFIVVAVAMFRALLGETGMLGSVLYHLFFFSILGIITMMFGLEVLFNPWFDLISFLIYIASFRLTGLILQRIKR